MVRLLVMVNFDYFNYVVPQVASAWHADGLNT